MGTGADYLFSSLFSDLIFLWGREHGHGILWVGMWGWEQFYSGNLFSKIFFHRMIQMIYFFSLVWKCVEGSDYMSCSLFSDLTFSWGQQLGDGSI